MRRAALFAIVALVCSHAFAADDDPGLADLTRRYDADVSYVSNFYSVPWSEARFDRMDRVYVDWAAKLAQLDFGKLSAVARVDYLLLATEIESNQSRLALDRKRLAEMDPLLPFRKTIQGLELARRRRENVEPQSAADELAKIPEQVKAVRERVEKGRKPPDSAPTTTQAADGPLPVAATLALKTARAIGDMQRNLADWHRYRAGFEPEFEWWINKPREAADAALNDYAKYLRETIAGVKGEPADPLIGDPIGEDGLKTDLRGEWIGYSPTELIAIGDAEFAWCERELKQASSELGCGDDWKAALTKVKEMHVPPGKQDDLVLEEAQLAVDFLKKNDLITIPPAVEEMWRIEMLSVETQKSLPYAVYGGQYVGVAYAAESMPHDDKIASMRGNNRHFLHIVMPHELIPGHHQQGYFAARERSYRRTFNTPFFVEGWAVYWEMRLWEKGYARNAADRIGMLFWRLHRCARILVSLKFHLGQMTPQEMIDFLVERVGHEKMGATSEVRRYIGGDYSPLYQCGYMIGAIQIRALHKELVESGKMTDKQFNDELMKHNAIPIELIRIGMTNSTVAREGRASWRFAGEPGAIVLPHP
jgi:uncharacterized protein (DUF885 family)